MTASNDIARILDASSHLIGTLIWPALVLFLILRFRGQLSSAMDDMRATMRNREFTVKAGPGGVELSAGARAATVLLEEAEARKPDSEPAATNANEAVRDAIGALEGRSAARERPRRRVLWVDDRPENNRLEQRALRELGLEVQPATSTEEALAVLDRQPFDVVISDMGRPPDPRAGYTLLEKMRERNDRTPFVIYAGSRAPEHVAEARQRGAIGTTNRSSELVQLVAQALNSRRD